MDHKQILNHRQMAWLIVSILLAGHLVSMPRALVEVGGVDAWFSQIFSIIYGFVVCCFFYTLNKTFPGKNLFDITFILLGKWAGGVVNSLFLCHIWLLLVRDCRAISDFIQTSLLLQTPGEVVVYAFLLVLIYYGRTSVEVIARVNDMIFPFVLLVSILLYILLIGEFSFHNTEPILGAGAIPVITSNLINTGLYGDLLVVGAFLHTLNHSKLLHASLRQGVLLAALLITSLLFLNVAVLGVSIARRSVYPSITMIEQIRITDFLDRLDLFLFSVWLPFFMIKVSFIFLAFISGIGRFSNDHNYPVLSIMGGWFIIVSTLASFDNVIEVFKMGNYALTVVSFSYQPLVFGLIWLLAMRYTRRHEAEKEKPMGTAYRKWMMRCYLFIGGAVAFLSIGILFGQDVIMVGMVGGVGYILCLLLAYVSALIETSKLNHSLYRKG